MGSNPIRGTNMEHKASITREELEADYENLCTADGLDEAIIGIDRHSQRVIYSVREVINILMTRDEMSMEDALDYYGYNIEGSWVGDQTPIWCYDI